MFKLTNIILIIILIISLYIFAKQHDEKQNDQITVEEVKEKIEKEEDIIIVDVRSKHEFNGSLGHLNGAILIPIYEFENRITELEKYKDKEVIVVCGTGYRSQKGTRILRKNGFKAFNLIGGMVEYRNLEKKEQGSAKKDSTGLYHQ